MEVPDFSVILVDEGVTIKIFHSLNWNRYEAFWCACVCVCVKKEREFECV